VVTKVVMFTVQIDGGKEGRSAKASNPSLSCVGSWLSRKEPNPTGLENGADMAGVNE